MRRQSQVIGLMGLLALTACAAGADPLELRDRQQLADGLFRRGLFELAAREYASLAEAPGVEGLDGVLFRLGECHRRSGRKAEAEEVYRLLVERHPASPNVPRAQLQRALILLDSGEPKAAAAAEALERLATPETPSEVRAAALYHLGEALEKLSRPAEALARYEQLGSAFAQTDYGVYAGLRAAWLLTRTGKPEDRRRAMGLYLELAHKAQDPKVAEEACYFAAQTALTDAKYEESANLFQMLGTRYPQSSRVLESALSAGWAYYYAGRYKESVTILDRVAGDARHPAREEILYVKANSLRQLEQRAEAVALYDQQLAAFPQGRLAKPARYERLTALYRDGQYAEVLKASAQFTDAPEEVADNVLWMSAESALAVKQPEVAVQNCRLLVDKYPASPFAKDALYRLGWLMQRQEAWESASSWYLLVAGRFPDDPLAAKALYASGVCLARLGQSEAALRDWTALLTRYPACDLVAETLYQKAMEEIRSKNLRAAGGTLDERMRRFPADVRQSETYYWRASIFRQTGETAEAERLYRQCLSGTPAKEVEREAMLELGMILQAGGRKAEAAEYFQKLLDAPIAEKLGADRLAWLAEFQCEQKQYDAAAQAAKTLIGQEADRGWKQTAWTLLGRIHRAKNERDPAIHALGEALATGATTAYGAEAALRLGELLTESGRYEEAGRHLSDAAARAASPELLAIRAHAYMGLAKNEELKGDAAAAARYYMSVGILFNDAELVPESIHRAALLLDKLGRAQEAETLRQELRERYPASPLARPVQPQAAGAAERKAES